ncbi:MAG: iron ABC transporter permease, partial [Candidatus Aminicenantes bacterium]|nr:iron ABC transporter permease [Candidatus Aminicenantes bacterium]
MIGQIPRRRKAWRVVVLILPLVLFLISLSIGTYAISPAGLGRTVMSFIFPSSHPDVPDAYRDILLLIRLPRLILAMAIGAALSVSGASLQALFKNPLVNEYILGISSGAAFGAALSLVFLGRAFPPQIAAFVFAVVAVSVVLLISGQAESHFISLLLTGIIVTAFFSALLSLVEFFASPYVLQALFFWLMGSLSLASWKDLAISLPLMAVGLIVLFLLRWRLNVLSMSDEEARSLGVNVRREKLLVIGATTLITAAGTSIVGIIGWVGFIVPHFVRLMFG